METKSTLIQGGSHEDNRGELIFFNTLNLEAVKRFYAIHSTLNETVRAWQWHQKECKWFYVTAGEFKVILVKIDNWQKPSGNLCCEEFILNHTNNQVLFVPGGYVTGFATMQKESKLIVFSNFTLEDSINDDFRFDKNLWYKW